MTKPKKKFEGISYKDVVEFIKKFQGETDDEIVNSIFAESLRGIESKVLNALVEYNTKIAKV
jgi:hypothetical protein